MPKKHAHACAYCMIPYHSSSTGETETLWNARDGLVPFKIHSPTTEHRLQRTGAVGPYSPDYTPSVGERIFVDCTEIRARILAGNALDSLDATERAALETRYPTREDAIAETIERMRSAYAKANSSLPDILVVTAGYLEGIARERRAVCDPLSDAFVDPIDQSIVRTREQAEHEPRLPAVGNLQRQILPARDGYMSITLRLPAEDQLREARRYALASTADSPQLLTSLDPGYAEDMAWFDRQGNPITFAQWSDLASDPEYRIVLRHQIAPDVIVETRWVGCDLSRGKSSPPLIFNSDIQSDLFPSESLFAATERDAKVNHATLCFYADLSYYELKKKS